MKKTPMINAKTVKKYNIVRIITPLSKPEGMTRPNR